jgi:hypothetical protein
LHQAISRSRAAAAFPSVTGGPNKIVAEFEQGRLLWCSRLSVVLCGDRQVSGLVE